MFALRGSKGVVVLGLPRSAAVYKALRRVVGKYIQILQIAVRSYGGEELLFKLRPARARHHRHRHLLQKLREQFAHFGGDALFAFGQRAVEVKGDQFVKSISVKDNASGKITEIPVVAVFVEIGMIPATDPVKGLVYLDEWGKIKVDAKNQRASMAGVWAAGDCSDGLYHQNNIAAGDAVKALEDIYFFLKAAK